MPSTYAHYRMGQQVRSMLDGNEKKIVEKISSIISYWINMDQIFCFIISH